MNFSIADLSNYQPTRIFEPMLLIILVVITIFALLILRQSSQMIHILPTRLSSSVMIAVWLYVIGCLVALGVAITIAFT